MTLLRRLTIHHSLQGIALGLFLAVNTLFLIDKGFNLWQIGFAFGCWSVSNAFFELPLGALADNYGRVRVYRWGLFTRIICFATAVWASTFPVMIFAMLIGGLGSALETGTISAWQIEQFKKQTLSSRLPQLLAKYRAIGALATAIGAMLGGYIPTLVHSSSLNFQPTANNLVLIIAVLTLHISMLRWLFREGDKINKVNEKTLLTKTIGLAISHAIHNPNIRALVLVCFSIGLVLSNTETYWQSFVKSSLHLTDYKVFGWIASGYFLAAAVGPLLYSLLLKIMVFKPENQITTILLVSALLLNFLPDQTTLTGFAIFHFGFIAVLVTINIPFEIILNIHSDDNIRSSMYSVLSLIMMLGGAVSAFVLASITQHFGIETVWKSLSIYLFVTGLFRLILKKNLVTKPPKRA